MNRDLDFKKALRKAHKAGKVKCDRISFYEKAEDAPVGLLGPYGVPGSIAVAWRGKHHSAVWIADQMLEQSNPDTIGIMLAEDLNAELDKACR